MLSDFVIDGLHLILRRLNKNETAKKSGEGKKDKKNRWNFVNCDGVLVLLQIEK